MFLPDKMKPKKGLISLSAIETELEMIRDIEWKTAAMPKSFKQIIDEHPDLLDRI